MRLVTENTIYANLAYSMLQNGNLVQQAQAHAAGLRVIQPADDPAAAAYGVQLSASLQSVAAMSSVSSQAAQFLATTDQALAGVSTTLAQAKEIAVQAANGTLSAGDRGNLAQVVQGMQNTLLQLANSRSGTSYVFGGYQIAAAPFQANGTYVGDNGISQLEVASGVQVAVNVAGSQVFTASGGQDLFAALSQLSTALSSNDVSGIKTALTALDAGQEQVLTARTQVGNSLSALRNADNMRQATIVQLNATRSSTVEIDVTQGMLNLVQAQSAYQAAVAQASRMLMGLDNGLTR